MWWITLGQNCKYEPNSSKELDNAVWCHLSTCSKYIFYCWSSSLCPEHQYFPVRFFFLTIGSICLSSLGRVQEKNCTSLVQRISSYRLVHSCIFYYPEVCHIFGWIILSMFSYSWYSIVNQKNWQLCFWTFCWVQLEQDV